MQDILAFASSYEHWQRCLHYAASLAGGLQASLTGLYVSEPIPVIGLPSMLPEFYTMTRDIALEAVKVAPQFDAWAAQFGIARHSWQVAEGYVAEVLAHASNRHDLLVVESGPHSAWGSASILGKILLACGLPCIVVPEKFAAQDAQRDCIAVAWNGSAESMRAVHAALPLLERAKRVVLIHGQKSDVFSSITWHPPLSIETYLAHHGIRFDVQPFQANGETAGSELVAVAQKNAADLLVMGAYGHARASEWVLGGATLHILEHAPLPVLLRH